MLSSSSLSSLSHTIAASCSASQKNMHSSSSTSRIRCTHVTHHKLPALLNNHIPAIPLAASLSIILWSTPVNAGILSGFSGLESVPGPELPEIDFLKKWNEDNQKKYAELDSRFKSSPVLKDLLEKSRLNKEKNKKEIQDKYCLRGAEWGVGDCSTEGMTQDEKDEFISMLKKKTGVE